MNQPIRQLTRAEVDFVRRAIMDTEHALVVLSWMRATEHTVGTVLDDENSFVMRHEDYTAALALAKHLVGIGPTPPLEENLDVRAAIEASGDAEALRLYEAWRKAAAARRQHHT